MRKLFKRINLYYKVSFISIFSVLIIFLILIAIFFKTLIIPFSFFFGGFFGSLFYSIYGYIEEKIRAERKMKWAIAITIIRFIVLLIIFVAEFLTFEFSDLILYEPISLVLGYFLPIIILVIINLSQERSKRKNDTH